MIFRLLLSIVLSLATTFCSLLVVHQQTTTTHVSICANCGTQTQHIQKGYPRIIERITTVRNLSSGQFSQKAVTNSKGFVADWFIWLGILGTLFVLPSAFKGTGLAYRHAMH